MAVLVEEQFLKEFMSQWVVVFFWVMLGDFQLNQPLLE